ncbi:MAG: class II aldolase/adducin family protein [Burkholderiales bacterium]|nr:class II aldolase/adducin family protein [Burkholderiales bacterium]
MSTTADLAATIRELVHANRILAHEGVVDAFGHVSVRHPHDPQRYLLACSRSPAIVTAADIMEFTLEGEAVDARGRRPYAERPIHGAVYEMRPDVNAVVHNHAYEVVPFSVSGAATLRAITHVSAVIGATVPVWDIRDKFGDTNLLVVTMAQGRDLAATLGGGRVALMRGHGCVVAGGTVRAAVNTAIYLRVNAMLQQQAMQLGDPQFLSSGEIERCVELQLSALALDRAWEYWSARAGCSAL